MMVPMRVTVVLVMLGCVWASGCVPDSVRTETSVVKLRSQADMINSIGMPFKYVPAGEVRAGSGEDELYREEWITSARSSWFGVVSARECVRVVRIAEPFYCGMTEVTQRQFRMFMPDKATALPEGLFAREVLAESGKAFAAKEHRDELNSTLSRNDHPVAAVSWEEAVAFCEWLSDLPAEKAAGRSYRLPTEEEWEYACRAGSQARYPWGEDDGVAARFCNRADQSFGGIWSAPHVPNALKEPSDGYAVSSPVGSFQPNKFGLYDMIGNVWELCASPFAAASPGAKTGGPLKYAVVRGGSWADGRPATRCAARYAVRKDEPWFQLGFRVVLVVKKAKSAGCPERQPPKR